MNNYNTITILLKLHGNLCNMHCKYCYAHVRKHDEINQTYSVNNVIQYLSQFKDYKHVFIIFHGGEPLLSKEDDIRIILEYIFSSFKNIVNVQIQTNGTLISDSWLRLFSIYRKQLSLSISLDPLGDKDLRVYPQNCNRDIVLMNIKKSVNAVENLGVVSVIHNRNFFDVIPFIYNLIDIGVKSVTINKYQSTNCENDEYFISEDDFVSLLIDLSKFYIMNKLYNKINIQPIMSLFSKRECKICSFMAKPDKCTYFKTYYGSDMQTDFCDHIIGLNNPLVPKKCLKCDIYEKCGSGCLVEKKDNSFCEARHKLFTFLKGVQI